MFQIPQRVWPAEAIHDTVDAVVRDGAFRRSIQSSIGERLMQWTLQWLERLFGFLDGRTSARGIALAFAALLALLLVARILLSARARDTEGSAGRRARRPGAGEDPWRAADLLAAEGRFEEAAHALYRGVVATLVLRERLRFDSSKTSGDYARELRARGSSSYVPFREFSRRFDDVVYGHRGSDESSLRDLVRLALPFSSRTLAA